MFRVSELEAMRYLDRPKTAGPSLARAPALYQSVPAGNLPTPLLFVKVFLQDGQIGHISTIAGVGKSGPNRDLFQERTALSGIAGTTYEPYQRTLGSRARRLMRGWDGVADRRRHEARANRIGLQETSR